MRISLAQYPPIKCVECKASFAPEIWVIVDINERPDLVQLIRDDIIHCAICPSCETVIALGMPLLVYRPQKSPPLLFSPVSGCTNEQRRIHGSQLLGLLRQRLGDQWKEEWLAQGVYTVPRSDLPALVDSTPPSAPVRSVAPEDILESFSIRQDLISLALLPKEQLCVALTARPELMSDRSIAELDAFIVEARARSQTSLPQALSDLAKSLKEFKRTS